MKRRSHSEAVAAALGEVERLRSSGIYVTPSAVARGAHISRANLYERQGARSEGWKRVITAIGVANEKPGGEQPRSKNASPDAELKALKDRLGRLDAVLARLDTLANKTFRTLFDNYILFWKRDRDRGEEQAQLAALVEEVTANRRHVQELEATNRALSASREPRQANPKISQLSKKMIICPDSYLKDEKGVYSFSKHRANEAWQRAIIELDEQLRARVPSIIFVLAGPQGSGKSTWAAQHRPVVPGISLYFDATLPSSSDRSAIVVRARRVGARVVCVRFLTPLDQCLRNCAQRDAERKIPDKIIRGVFETFEEITVDEGFDEIHLIRPLPNA